MTLVCIVTITAWLAGTVAPPVPAPPAEVEPTVEPDDESTLAPAEAEPTTAEPAAPPSPEPPALPPDPEPPGPVVTPEPEPTSSSPDPVSSPPVAIVDPETAPLEADARYHPSPDDESFRRRGVLLTTGVGLTHCAQDFCSPIVMGGLARIELGYRFGHVALVGTVAGGGATADEAETGLRSLRMLDVAAGLLFLPVAKGRVDPYLGASLGYARTIQMQSEDSGRDRQFDSRAALRLSGGIAWYVRPRFALGPRADVRLPFAGKYCTRFIDDTADDSCVSIRDEIIEANPDADAYEKRRQRRAFAHPWALTLDLRFIF